MSIFIIIVIIAFENLWDWFLLLANVIFFIFMN